MRRPTRSVLGLAAVAVATVAVWLAASELAWPARMMTTLLLVPLPALLLGQGRAADVEMARGISRHALYLSSAASIWALALVAVVVASDGGFTRAQLGLVPITTDRLAMAGGLTLVAGLAIMSAARLAGIRETGILRHLIPATTGERIAFVGLSVSAGIGEELVYRSFLIPALDAAVGSLWIATAISSVAFGLVHSYQGATGIARASLLGGILAAPFLLTGSVYPSMVAHTLLDIVAGIWLARWLIR